MDSRSKAGRARYFMPARSNPDLRPALNHPRPTAVVLAAAGRFQRTRGHEEKHMTPKPFATVNFISPGLARLMDAMAAERAKHAALVKRFAGLKLLNLGPVKEGK
jgi:hypothetical protein